MAQTFKSNIVVDNTVTATTFIGALTGNASTATAFSGTRTVTLTGDVTGSTTTWTGSGTLTIATTIAANSVALGTDTTGNYVAGITAGQGINVTGTAGEGWSPTVALKALDLTLFPTSNFKKSVKAATTANIALTGAQTIDGIACAVGDRVLVKNQTTSAQNGIYVVASGAWTRSVAADGSTEIDNAIVAVDQGTTNGGQYYTNTFKTTDVVGTTNMPWYRIPIDSAGYTYAFGISGNAATATTLQTARTINGVSFNGSANITITANTPQTLTRGTYLTGSNFNGSTATTWAVDATSANTASKVVARDASGNFSAGTITASLSGNASTATSAATWTTARTLSLTGDVTGTSAAFNGSGNISIATTIAANSVALGTDTTGNYVGDVTAGTGITIGGSAGEGTSRSIGLLAADLTLFPTSNYKKSVKAATTANITLSAPQTIDGVSCVAGDRVLVKNQTTASQNGIYIVNAAAWTRSVAADGSNEIDNALVAVDQGTTNGGHYFTNVFKTTDVVGTTSMPWYKIVFENSGNWAINVTGSAATLTTARTINGTSFNGSANITTANWGTARTINGTSINGSTNYTTANWGTARTLTIGNTGKSVNGSANVSWSLAEIGALPSANGTITGTLVVSDGASIAYADANGTYVPRPAGAYYRTATDAHTGAIKITFPGDLPDDMMSFWVDIYDYAGTDQGESVSLYIYGYAYTNVSPYWTNTGAIVLTDRTDRDYTVRFGWDGTNHCVTIGETTSSWNYPQVNLRDLQAGYTASYTTFDNSISISFVTTLPTIGRTSSSNYVAAKTAQTLQTARTINGVSFNGSANITVEPYVERDDTSNATRYLTFVDDATAAYKRLNMDNGLSFNPSTGFLTATTFVGGLVGNANTASTLFTARTINGTSFNGSANITTASWGTSRNLTIGSATKAVNGSADVSFTLAEIGIAPGSASFPDLTNKDLGTGSYITSGDYRAPIFYDSTDVNYYLHPNGFSNLSSGRFNSNLEVLGTLTYGAFSTGTNGYTRLPNGFIIQWARYTQTNDSTTTVSYPLAFPTAVLGITIAKGRTSTGVSTQTNAPAVSLNNNSTFWCNANDVGGTGYVAFIIAIGY